MSQFILQTVLYDDSRSQNSISYFATTALSANAAAASFSVSTQQWSFRHWVQHSLDLYRANEAELIGTCTLINH